MKLLLDDRVYLTISCGSAGSGRREAEQCNLNEKFVHLLCGGGDSFRGDHYRILVMNTPEDYMIQYNYQWMRDNLSFLIDTEWKAIFDFDCNGHVYNYVESEGVVVKETKADEFDDNSEFNRRNPDQLERLVDDIQHSAKQPSWIFVNGRGAEESYSPYEWNINRARGFKKAVQFYSSVFPCGRATVVFLLFSADIGVLVKAAYEFLTDFPNQWMCVIQEEDVGKKWSDKLIDMDLIESDERIVVGMPWSHINETVLRLQAPKKRRVCEIPTSTGATVMLPFTVVNRLPDIDVLGCNECDAEYQRHDENQKEKLKKDEEIKFYRGEPPSWWNFWFRTQVCERDIHNKLRRIVEQALRSSSDHSFVERVRIYHQPGAGGTTSAMHILWTTRSYCRVGIVQNCSNRLSSEQIQKLVCEILDFHKYAEREQTKARPLLLFLDNPDEETESLLLDEINERAKSMVRVRHGVKSSAFCVFLECLRLTEMSTLASSAIKVLDHNCVFLKHKLPVSEITWFKEKGQALQDDFDTKASNSVDPDSLISFNILKSNFNKEFMSNTVGALVKAITNDKEKTLLKYISLLNSFDIQYRAVPLAAFDCMMTEVRIVKKKVVFSRWENELSDAFHVFVYETSEADIGYSRALCSKNALLAKESLEALLRTSDGKETVGDIVLEFFKCSVFDSKSREKLLNIVQDVLKKRQRLPNGVHDGDFSPLILHILQTESIDKAHAVLKEGYKLTNDPFVAQHLARLLYIKLGDWNQASDVINSAIVQLPDNSYLWDTHGRIYQKQLSAEYARYKDGVKRLMLDRVTEVVDLALKGIEMFQKGQSVSELEKTANDVGYYGELHIICTLMDCLACCGTFQEETKADLKKFLLNENFIPTDFDFLKNVKGRDYIRILKDLKPRVDTVLKRLEDEKLQLKLDVKYVQSPTGSLVKLMERLVNYFGEDPSQLPQDLSENDQCSFRRRQIFRLAGGNNMNSIFEQRWKDNGEKVLKQIRDIIKMNIHSAVVSAHDYLIAISINLALTSINPKCCGEIKFDEMLEWSRKLYETRQSLIIDTKMNPIYLEPYLFMTMFNWPRENTSPIFVPSEVHVAVCQWKEEFYTKYPRLKTEGKPHHKKEKTLFFLANGSGMESIYTSTKDDLPRENDSDFWQQEHTKTTLQRFEGILERPGTSVNYHFGAITLNIPTSLPIVDRSLWKKKVYFVIGFSWAGPKAYDVSLDNPATTRRD